MPVNPKAKLVKNLFDKKITQKPTRDGYGEGLVEAGAKNENVVVLCADLTESTRSLFFKQKFPNRFVEIGVAEQNMAAIAAGMSLMGKVPFISSYAVFSPGRNWEQIRTTIAYNDANVKIAGAHAGISVGPDGATHQALEDMAIMRAMPNMKVFCPADSNETKKITEAISQIYGPCYLRFAREKTPLFTTEETPFEIGKALTLWEGEDATIIACGPLVYNALLAAKELEEQDIYVSVINSPSIKPLDTEAVINAAQKTGAIVTVEEHQIIGGLGGAVAELLAKEHPTSIEFIGVHDRFGESGEPNELIKKYGMDVDSIKQAVHKVLTRKIIKK